VMGGNPFQIFQYKITKKKDLIFLSKIKII